MHPIREGIVESLNSRNIEFEEKPDFIDFKFQGSSGIWPCRSLILEKSYQLIVYSYYPFSYPIEKENQLMRYCHMINYNLPLGLLEMDFESKCINFKLAHDFSKTEVNLHQIEYLIALNLQLADCYFMGISQLINTDMDLNDIIDMVEEKYLNISDSN